MPGTQDHQSQQQALEQLRTELARAHRTIEALQRAKRRVGLSFNRIPETGSHIAHLWAGDTPVLDYVPECSLAKAPGAPRYAPDAPVTLIEADNWAALSLLQQTHRGRVDVIYIDPPYNTGNEDFIYNDARRASMAELGLTGADYEATLDGKARAVGKDDPERHSSWISFMEPRLWLAKQLLADTGVIFVSIDDYEHARLKLVLDGIFGEENAIGTLYWRRGGGKNDSRFLANVTEYVLAYRRGPAVTNFRRKASNADNYKLVDEEGRRYTLEKLDRGGLEYRPNCDYKIAAPDGATVYPNGDAAGFLRRAGGGAAARDWQWRWSRERFESETASGNVVFIKRGQKWAVYTKSYFEGKTSPYRDTFDAVGNAAGGEELRAIFGAKPFDFPKPTELLRFLLGLPESPSDAVILDFFAGSGTTAHAVAQLNAEDGGTRQCILVTHGDENGKNIAADITAERLKRVLSGENWADGKEHPALPGDLVYYRLGWVPKASNTYSALEALQGRFAGIAALAHDAHERLEETDEYVVLGNSKRLVVVWQSEEALVDDPEEAFYPLLDRFAAAHPDRELLVYTPSTLSAEDDEYDVRSRGWTPVAFPGDYVSNHAALVEQMKRNGLLQPPFQGSEGVQDGAPAGEPGDAITGEPGDETGEDL